MSDSIPHVVTFPHGFVRGTASSSHQSEGQNIHNDWWEWEQEPGRIVQGQPGTRQYFLRTLRRLTPYPPNAARLTQLGNCPYPEGLLLALQRVRDAALGIPIYVAENGIGTDDDRWRIQYIAQHLVQIGRAIGDGCDVRGYFHWTSVDNFEWHLEWTAQFGLIGFDRDTFVRRPKPSAYFLGAVAKRNALLRKDLEAYGANQFPTTT